MLRGERQRCQVTIGAGILAARRCPPMGTHRRTRSNVTARNSTPTKTAPLSSTSRIGFGSGFGSLTIRPSNTTSVSGPAIVCRSLPE
jgi:hypothetical protein